MIRIEGIPPAIIAAEAIASDIFALTRGSVKIRTFSPGETTATSFTNFLAALANRLTLKI
jgi:hypothetical protein